MPDWTSPLPIGGDDDYWWATELNQMPIHNAIFDTIGSIFGNIFGGGGTVIQPTEGVGDVIAGGDTFWDFVGGFFEGDGNGDQQGGPITTQPFPPDPSMVPTPGAPELGFGQFSGAIPGGVTRPPHCGPNGVQRPTNAHHRSLLLQTAGYRIGQCRMRYKVFRSFVRYMGVERAGTLLGLRPVDVGFLLSHPPKRQGRYITHAQVRNVRKTTRKFEALQNTLGCCPKKRTYRRKKVC